MKIAVLGGGFAGLSAAFYLRRKGYDVTVIERESVVGGLAVGFKQPNWKWPLERAYHHLFATDSSILTLAKDIGFEGIFFQTPQTAFLYKKDTTYQSFPVDAPLDLLALPNLSLVEKIRAGLVILCLKHVPHLSIFDKETSNTLFSKFMGNKAWNMLLGEQLRKKFGKYAEIILASFIWARLHVRTSALGYSKGGFQTFIEHIEKTIQNMGVTLKKSHEVQKIVKKGDKFDITYKNSEGTIQGERFDRVISTLPIPIMNRITEGIFPSAYINKFKKLKYLHAVVLIIESKEAILDKTYWLSICPPEIPLMFVGQHTNFINKKYYGGNHIAYVARYVTEDDPMWGMNEKELIKYIEPYIKQINAKFSFKGAKTYIFKAPYAQPVFDADFLKNKPDFETPIKHFYIANLDMTYPNDRGTNYAVKIGKEVSEKIK